MSLKATLSILSCSGDYLPEFLSSQVGFFQRFRNQRDGGHFLFDAVQFCVVGLGAGVLQGKGRVDPTSVPASLFFIEHVGAFKVSLIFYLHS